MQAFRSAGVSPAFLQRVDSRNIAGETPALQNPRPKSHLDEIRMQAEFTVRYSG